MQSCILVVVFVCICIVIVCDCVVFVFICLLYLCVFVLCLCVFLMYLYKRGARLRGIVDAETVACYCCCIPGRGGGVWSLVLGSPASEKISFRCIFSCFLCFWIFSKQMHKFCSNSMIPWERGTV